MSLIQEALRRQQEESGKSPDNASPPPFQEPSAPKPPQPSVSQPEQGQAPAQGKKKEKPKPPPIPSQPPEKKSKTEAQVESQAQPSQDMPPDEPKEDVSEEEHASDTSAPAGKPWRALAGIAALILVLVGGGIWMLVYAFQHWNKPDTEETAETETSAETVKDKPEKESGNGTATPGTITRTNTSGDAETSIVSSGDVDTEDKTAFAADTGTDIAEKEIIWPLFSITGIAGRGKNGSVIINNEIVPVGHTVEGARLLSIEPRGAWMSYKGQKKFIRLELGARP